MIVGTEKVLREADGPVERLHEESASGRKVIAFGCAREPVHEAGREPEYHKRFRPSNRCSICLYAGQNGGCVNVIKKKNKVRIS